MSKSTRTNNKSTRAKKVPGPLSPSRFNATGHRHGSFVAASILIVAIAWATYVHWTAPQLPFDDAFITFRYVLNLTDGKGPVYNEGQRVLGCTAPLYLLVLTALKISFSSVTIPSLAICFNAIPYAVTGLGAYLLLRHATGIRWFAALGAASLIVNPVLLAWSIGGMESSLFTALMLFAILAAARRRAIWLGLLIGLACLTRPEGILLLPIALIALIRSKRALLITAATFALAVGPWILFAWMYYGSPIPLSVIAKSKPLYPIPPGYALWSLIVMFEEWVTAQSLRQLGQLRTVLVLDLVLASTGAALVHKGSRARWAWGTGLLFWAFVALYYFGNPKIFPWYLPPIFVSAAVVVLAGLPAGACLLAAWARRQERALLARYAVPVTLGVTLTVLAMATVESYRKPGSVSLTTSDPIRLRIHAYRQAAEMLNRICSETDTVATPEVGALGFYCKARILDACGLVSPEALAFLPVPPHQRQNATIGAISTDFVRYTRPDYVVTMLVFASHSLARSEWFVANYDMIGKIPLPKMCWDSKTVLIFKRKGAR